jgi:hypothetical protein
MCAHCMRPLFRDTQSDQRVRRQTGSCGAG